MNNNEDAELVVWNDGYGNQVRIELTEMQWAIVKRILGIEFEDEFYSFHSDNSLIKLTELSSNPLRLEKIKNKL